MTCVLESIHDGRRSTTLESLQIDSLPILMGEIWEMETRCRHLKPLETFVALETYQGLAGLKEV